MLISNNIATSDELEAAPIYQDKMGTAYSKSKHITRAFNVAGISLILTAAAIKTGGETVLNSLASLNQDTFMYHGLQCKLKVKL